MTTLLWKIGVFAWSRPTYKQSLQRLNFHPPSNTPISLWFTNASGNLSDFTQLCINCGSSICVLGCARISWFNFRTIGGCGCRSWLHWLLSLWFPLRMVTGRGKTKLSSSGGRGIPMFLYAARILLKVLLMFTLLFWRMGFRKMVFLCGSWKLIGFGIVFLL